MLRPPPATTALLLRPHTLLSPTPSLISPILPITSRPFFSLPTGPPFPFPSPTPTQTVSATRTLPHPPAKLFELVADVDSYSAFVPYCSLSRVTRWSEPESDTLSNYTSSDYNNNSSSSSSNNVKTRRWPVRADLRVGWGGFDETYTSRLCCVPARGIVEAISGDVVSDLPEARAQARTLRGHNYDDDDDVGKVADGAVFRSLVTRWTISPAAAEPGAATADLQIRFQFVNPLYAIASSAVSDSIAVMMIQAFEERARQVLGHSGDGRPIRRL